MNLNSFIPSTGRSLLLFTLMAVAIHSSFAQADKTVDSLMRVLKTGREDTNTVKTLNTLSKKLIALNDYAQAKTYLDSSLILSQKLNFKKGMRVSYLLLGIVYDIQGNYPEALKNAKASLKIAEEIGDKKGIASAYDKMGNYFFNQGKYDEALKCHQVSLQIRKELGDKGGMAASYNQIGIVYDDLGNYPEAVKNYLESMKIAQETGDQAGFATANNNVGIIYQRQGNFTEALKNYQVSLEIRKKLGDKSGIFDSSASIGDLYYQQKNYADAFTIYQEALQIAEETEDKRRIADTYECIGNIYKDQNLYTGASKNYQVSLDMREEMDDKSGIVESCNNMALLFTKMHEYAKAEKYLEKALSISQEIGYIDGIQAVYLSIASLDTKQGNFEDALGNYILYTQYKDSLFNETNNKQIAEMKEKYESDKKENEIVLLNKEKDIQDLELKKQKLTKNYFLAGSVLIAILSFFIYRNYRTQHQLKLQTLRNKIAIDLHDDVGSTLSSISIFSQMAQQQSKEVIPYLDVIGESSRKMLDAMADIVWTINPENDQFEKIILRMRSFAYELLGARQIDFRFVADSNIANIKLSMEARRNLYLIFKEATNNLVKYAAASNAMFSLKNEQGKLVMLIKDNGKGFDSAQETQGNGLKNMKKRAMEIGAQLLIDSIPGNGTTIKLELVV